MIYYDLMYKSQNTRPSVDKKDKNLPKIKYLN